MNKNKWLIPSVVIVLALGAVGGWTYFNNNSSEIDGDIAATENLAPAAGEEEFATERPADGPQSTAADAPATEDVAVEDVKLEETPAEATPSGLAPTPQEIKVVVDGNDPASPRSVGSIDAPVTIVEYASLTCPHCADAHKNIVPRLIKDYVEPGKVRIVFNDFPLNKEALDASLVARCVSNDQYFNFLTLLFGSIESWASAADHQQALITNATMTGLSADRAKECLADKKVEDAIIAGIQEATSKKGVNATPTFIMNDGAKSINGARPYEEFKAAIDELLAK